MCVHGDHPLSGIACTGQTHLQAFRELALSSAEYSKQNLLMKVKYGAGKMTHWVKSLP